MTEPRGAWTLPSPARHERPAIDDAGARGGAARRPAAGRGAGRSASTRWATFLEPLPERLRDDELAPLRRTAMRARAAYGPKDSVRDALPGALTEPFLDAIDRLIRELNREAHRARELTATPSSSAAERLEQERRRRGGVVSSVSERRARVHAT